MQFLLVLLTCTFSITALSQNYVYKGDKQFIATQNWEFKLTNYNWYSTELGVCVAKTKTGGYLMLSIGVPSDEAIGGNVFLILENRKTITLTTRVVSDHVDSKSQVLYVISPTHFQLLKLSSILKIRVSLRNPKSSMGGNANYTATNKIDEYYFGDEQNSWDTASEIIKLDAVIE